MALPVRRLRRALLDMTAFSRGFGAAILKADGSLDRDALGRLVFSDIDARRGPGGHRPSRRLCGDRTLVRGALEDRPRRRAIADIPLLFETRREDEFDTVVVASCPVALQKARVMERDGLSGAEADRPNRESDAD
jgi:dephospho-CoA kinase